MPKVKGEVREGRGSVEGGGGGGGVSGQAGDGRRGCVCNLGARALNGIRKRGSRACEGGIEVIQKLRERV